MKRQIYQVTGMSCGKCVARVEDAIKTVPGVQNAIVTLNPPQATVESDREIPQDLLQAAVSEAGDYQLQA